MNEDNGSKKPLLPDEPSPDDLPSGGKTTDEASPDELQSGDKATDDAARRRTWLWVGVALIAVLAIILAGVLLRGGKEPDLSGRVRLPAGPPPVRQPETAVAPAPDQPSADDGYQGFEETLGVPLERMVRQVDYALVETLLLTGYDPQAMSITEVRLERYHDEQYHFQALAIEIEGNTERFLSTLTSALGKWAPEASLIRIGDAWQVTVVGQITHLLRFHVVEPVPAVPEGGRLSIVIDDLGRSIRFAKQLIELPFSVTFSVLPFEPQTVEVARIAAMNRHEMLLHLPMEPKGYPGVNPGQGALFTSMAPQELRRVLAADLARVPGAVGVNNHMGSKFTQTGTAMAVVMAELKTRNLFFLDSLTAPRSTGAHEGLAAGLNVYKRSIFLDNIRDTGAILRQLEKAEHIAGSTGQAVAIGHPYPETLAALKTWGERQDRTVRVVPVRELKPLHP
ncbi:MAG: divergent polysaccharide deacetylase family protein [Proteobacteria bacterium]|nr:divergent polysaccharide deacetylase family protein [Pseudomonadota bacterium]